MPTLTFWITWSLLFGCHNAVNRPLRLATQNWTDDGFLIDICFFQLGLGIPLAPPCSVPFLIKECTKNIIYINIYFKTYRDLHCQRSGIAIFGGILGDGPNCDRQELGDCETVGCQKWRRKMGRHALGRQLGMATLRLGGMWPRNPDSVHINVGMRIINAVKIPVHRIDSRGLLPLRKVHSKQGNRDCHHHKLDKEQHQRERLAILWSPRGRWALVCKWRCYLLQYIV